MRSRLVLGLLVCASCASSSSSAADPPADPGVSCDTSVAVSFATDVIPVFARTCDGATCHGKANALAENLYLAVDGSDGGQALGTSDVATIRAALVGVKAFEDPSMDLVTAGDLDGSYLWHKLKGDPNAESSVAAGCMVAANGSSPCSDCIPSAPCGAQMPLGLTLEPSAICTIKTWIAEGATND